MEVLSAHVGEDEDTGGADSEHCNGSAPPYYCCALSLSGYQI